MSTHPDHPELMVLLHVIDFDTFELFREMPCFGSLGIWMLNVEPDPQVRRYLEEHQVPDWMQEGKGVTFRGFSYLYLAMRGSYK